MIFQRDKISYILSWLYNICVIRTIIWWDMSVVLINLRLKCAFLRFNIFTSKTWFLMHFTQILKTSILCKDFWSVVDVWLEIKSIHFLLNLLFLKLLTLFVLRIESIKSWCFRRHYFRFKVNLRLETKLRWLLLFQ